MREERQGLVLHFRASTCSIGAGVFCKFTHYSLAQKVLSPQNARYSYPFSLEYLVFSRLSNPSHVCRGEHKRGYAPNV